MHVALIMKGEVTEHSYVAQEKNLFLIEMSGERNFSEGNKNKFSREKIRAKVKNILFFYKTAHYPDKVKGNRWTFKDF